MYIIYKEVSDSSKVKRVILEVVAKKKEAFMFFKEACIGFKEACIVFNVPLQRRHIPTKEACVYPYISIFINAHHMTFRAAAQAGTQNFKSLKHLAVEMIHFPLFFFFFFLADPSSGADILSYFRAGTLIESVYLTHAS